MKDMVAWFGLKCLPFDKEIKTKDLFESDSLVESLARLDFMKQRLGCMLLTGDPGVGKTVALRHFVDSLNPNLFRPFYTPLSTLKGADIFRHLNHLLGLIPRGAKSDMFTQLQEEILDSREQRGRTVLFILDEAQLLHVGTLQELRLLTNFKMDSFDPFIFILSGQSDLKRVMDYAIMEPFSQRLRMRYHMPPLTKEDTDRYIPHHLKLAGSTEPIFSDDAIGAIHELSFGIPRRIGAMALQALTTAMFQDLRTVDADTVMKIKTGG
jgi:type II secretory pathway predicted ATPase ExeA